jgi:outer membrane protein assembly factor BamB
VARRVRSLSIALVIVLISGVVSGQQPKRKPQTYVAPLLPAEQAWKIALPAPPSAGAVMDDRTVYVPLADPARAADEVNCAPASLIALERDTGDKRWTSFAPSCFPPVLTHGLIAVATGNEIQALEPKNGLRVWSVTLDRPVRAPMIAAGSLLLAMLEGDELFGVDVERRVVVWRRSVGESGPLLMTADAQAAYVATNAGRVTRIQLSDGSPSWERQLAGELSEPTVDGDRLFVGSNATWGSFWSLDVRTGKDKARPWRGGVFGGAVVGSAVLGDRVLVVSKDNLVHALERRNNNQIWFKPAGVRPAFPPRAFAGVVAVVGRSPVLSTFRADTGAAVATWTGPQTESLLQGPPLMDTPRPFAVSIVVVFRDGQVFGLRSTELMLKEPALVPFTALPGRALPRETSLGPAAR